MCQNIQVMFFSTQAYQNCKRKGVNLGVTHQRRKPLPQYTEVGLNSQNQTGAHAAPKSQISSKQPCGLSGQGPAPRQAAAGQLNPYCSLRLTPAHPEPSTIFFTLKAKQKLKSQEARRLCASRNLATGLPNQVLGK